MNINLTLKGAYTINEFSAWSTLSRSRIYAEIRSKRLKKTKIGRRTVITYHDACDWLNAFGE